MSPVVSQCDHVIVGMAASLSMFVHHLFLIIKASINEC